MFYTFETNKEKEIMNTRQTSIDCYYKIKEEGLLTKMRLEYYEAIFNNAPCTSGEAYDAMITGKVVGKSHRIERARFTELRRMGVIKEVGERKCKISGIRTIVYDLTDELPTDLPPKITKKDRLNKALNAFRKLYKNKDTSTVEDWTTVANLIKKI